MAITVDVMYGDLGMSDEDLYVRLDRSLAPRSPSALFDKVAALGLAPSARALDAGARDAAYACELASRFGLRVDALDAVARNVDNARRRIAEGGFEGRVEARLGRVEALAFGDGTFDLVWCRDVLNHVPDLPRALREFARVLRPGGAAVTFQTFATELLEPREAARLYAGVATVAANMDRDRFEREAAAAGLALAERDEVASEWREFREEDGSRHTSRQLLRIARMLRARDALVREVGATAYEVELADCHWGVYQMLGKLRPAIHVLRRPAAGAHPTP